MIVFITARAETDLERIADYIAMDNPQRAVSFIHELVDRCERLADTPNGFSLVPRYEHTGIRRRPYGNYLIFYRVGEDRIEILHILNGAQDFESILFPRKDQ
ncbi:type II toxin-antitoxin system RelE/ParE family toxin [Rhizobium sophoriradicis]|uniref:type II toxin-antitoxin system RelE/ParE family toxin n=1 Tax=Rhizobium sophoriradicis TaxID=1535245 RepID=UPI000BBD9BE9|nr:type II toxin-antitoxin system RelE/ParE family toxin [Rhizobium sophoriradicis]PCK88442.1 plasmid stabilization protein [Rhizobium sophoriradicis]UWU33434.1 type II toxin-antitoxin system RelE/ParE family toxin [Rhizobium leguminosarum bv. phaseoli]